MSDHIADKRRMVDGPPLADATGSEPEKCCANCLHGQQRPITCLCIRNPMIKDWWKSNITPNAPAQAGRGNGARLLTDAQSRPCLKPDGWAVSFSSLIAANIQCQELLCNLPA